MVAVAAVVGMVPAAQQCRLQGGVRVVVAVMVLHSGHISDTVAARQCLEQVTGQGGLAMPAATQQLCLCIPVPRFEG